VPSSYGVEVLMLRYDFSSDWRVDKCDNVRNK
jgi:hypothetical protein